MNLDVSLMLNVNAATSFGMMDGGSKVAVACK